MITELIRENIKKLKPYTCARDLYSKGILLDANENSIGSSVEDFESLNLNRYPDPHQEDLKELINKHLGIKKEYLFFGVGSDEIIDITVRIFCEPQKDTAIIVEPTYGMYKVACDINNVETKQALLNKNFDIDIENIASVYDDTVKVIFLCSPNNPTGNLLSRKQILEVCKRFNCIVFVDEAYIDFSGSGASVVNDIKDYPNLIVSRTFSKAWGLAAIRLGYCVADTEIIGYYFKVKAPYNINILTRFALEKAISNFERKNNFVSLLISERARLSEELKNTAGIQNVYHSDANYLLFRCKHAKAVQHKLAELGVVVRDRSSQIMLDDCLRVSIGTQEENNEFLKQLNNVLTNLEQ
jgi:histidinol-phosphate aminotransferase